MSSNHPATSDSITSLLLTLAREPAAELALRTVVALIRGEQIPEDRLREINGAVAQSHRVFGLIIGELLPRDVNGALVLLAEYLNKPASQKVDQSTAAETAATVATA